MFRSCLLFLKKTAKPAAAAAATAAKPKAVSAKKAAPAITKKVAPVAAAAVAAKKVAPKKKLVVLRKHVKKSVVAASAVPAAPREYKVTAYALFVREAMRKPEVAGLATFRERSLVVSQRWKALTAEEKQPYADLASSSPVIVSNRNEKKPLTNSWKIFVKQNYSKVAGLDFKERLGALKKLRAEEGNTNNNNNQQSQQSQQQQEQQPPQPAQQQ